MTSSYNTLPEIDRAESHDGGRGPTDNSRDADRLHRDAEGRLPQGCGLPGRRHRCPRHLRRGFEDGIRGLLRLLRGAPADLDGRRRLEALPARTKQWTRAGAERALPAGVDTMEKKVR